MGCWGAIKAMFRSGIINTEWCCVTFPRAAGCRLQENAFGSVCQQRYLYGMRLEGIYPIIFSCTFQNFPIIFIASKPFISMVFFEESFIVSIMFHNNVFFNGLIVCQSLSLFDVYVCGACVYMCVHVEGRDWLMSSVFLSCSQPYFGEYCFLVAYYVGWPGSPKGSPASPSAALGI